MPASAAPLRNAAASTAGLTAMSMFPPAIRRALAIPANNRTGTINDVDTWSS